MWNNNRQLSKVKKILHQINLKKEEMASLTDDELAGKTQEFKERLTAGESLDDILVEAFAVVREADKRILGMFPYDVQVMGGIVIHQGNVAEMNTGEGKTLTATMPVYLNALSGQGVMLVTTNDYLAKRDAEEMGQVYEFLGLTIRIPFPEEDDDEELTPEDKREVYSADVVYTTNSGLGFDYLLDNLASSEDKKYMPEFNFVIIDEVDAVLLDSAQIPLVISGSPRVQSNFYEIIDTLMTTLVEGQDYIFKEEKKEVWLTTKGAKTTESFLGIDNLYSEEHSVLARHLIFALRAHTLFKRDKDYIIRKGEKDEELVLLDQGTGRLLEMTKLQGGLHQAIEAKEHVSLSEETRAMASITYQSLFKKFKKISGMTGTGKVAEKEFLETYGMSVIRIPTNCKNQRIDYPDNLYVTLPEKVYASLAEIKYYHEKGNPLLIFVGSVEMSELYSSLLLREGIAHNVLNAHNAAREAQMIAESGRRGAVTVATSMAGRGTDIKLGKGVKELGGLVVIGSERHESRRIDNQFRGRGGRQGDPGETQFYVSTEDDLMRIFQGERIAMLMDRLGVPEDMPIQHKSVSKTLENAQKRVEGFNFDTRKNVVQYDNVINRHRKVVYTMRRKILEGEDITAEIKELFISKAVELAEIPSKNNEKFVSDFVEIFPIDEEKIEALGRISNDKKRIKLAKHIAEELYQDKENEIGKEAFQKVEREVYMQILDTLWMNHLENMNFLREGIHWRSVGQRDPLVEYRAESQKLFDGLQGTLRDETIRILTRITPNDAAVRQDEDHDTELTRLAENSVEKGVNEVQSGEKNRDEDFSKAKKATSKNNENAKKNSARKAKKAQRQNKKKGRK